MSFTIILLKNMKRINNYILEKLKINKDTNIENNYLEDILIIIDALETANDKVKELINTWLNDYSNTLYCYCSDKEYKDRLEGLKSDISDKISINKIDNSLMAKAINLASGATIYHGKDDGNDVIEKIQDSQYDIAFYIYGKIYPIIFEKSKI